MAHASDATVRQEPCVYVTPINPSGEVIGRHFRLAIALCSRTRCTFQFYPANAIPQSQSLISITDCKPRGQRAKLSRRHFRCGFNFGARADTFFPSRSDITDTHGCRLIEAFKEPIKGRCVSNPISPLYNIYSMPLRMYGPHIHRPAEIN